MEHIPKSNAEVFTSDAVTSWEYDTTSGMNMALIRIDGRYPQEGYTRNLEVDSLVQVVKGSGKLQTPTGEDIILSEGDQLHLAKNDAYCFEGALELVYAATPKWTSEQTEQTH